MKAVHPRTAWLPLVAAGPVARRPRPLAFCISAGTAQFSSDVLVLDATNILSRAAADAKRWTGAPGLSVRSCFEDWIAFLMAAAGAPPTLVAVFDNPRESKQKAGKGDSKYLRRRRRRHQPRSASAAKLRPFIEAVESQQGFALVAEGGYEADECIGACCAALGASHASRSVLIASGDTDMQQHLGPHTAWLEILPLPTLQSPAGLAVTGAADFIRARGFPPEAYPDFLAFTGKREASIGGVGVGSSAAAKLVKRFGGVEGAAAAAAAGELRGWGPAVEAALTTPERLEQLNANMAVFRGETDPAQVLTLAQQAALAELPSDRRTAAVADAHSPDDLAWLHPYFAGRWRQAEPMMQRLAAQLEEAGAGAGSCRVQATAGPGVPVDVLADGRSVMVAAPCDFAAPQEPASPPPLDLAAALAPDAPSRLADPCGVFKSLNRASQHHISLLKKAGNPPLLIPYWVVAD